VGTLFSANTSSRSLLDSPSVASVALSDPSSSRIVTPSTQPRHSPSTVYVAAKFAQPDCKRRSKDSGVNDIALREMACRVRGSQYFAIIVLYTVAISWPRSLTSSGVTPAKAENSKVKVLVKREGSLQGNIIGSSIAFKRGKPASSNLSRSIVVASVRFNCLSTIVDPIRQKQLDSAPFPSWSSRNGSIVVCSCRRLVT
jgi:hypothetical protein